ncbi:NAD(P)H pyrophosphatase NUDT13, mitochondrial isoform X1 [Scleropages formosus]|nr:nucleoside diphosphate-linked moiety X motif 13 isoform X1 [Scleropages formosus]
MMTFPSSHTNECIKNLHCSVAWALARVRSVFEVTSSGGAVGVSFVLCLHYIVPCFTTVYLCSCNCQISRNTTYGHSERQVPETKKAESPLKIDLVSQVFRWLCALPVDRGEMFTVFTMRRMLGLHFGSHFLGARSCSSYVSKMRYLMRLKEDDKACQEALHSGTILLYHKLAPLLRKTETGAYELPVFQAPDVSGILDKLGKDKELLNNSVLIGCSDTHVAQFSLDVGAVEQAAAEGLCGGVFVDLRKAFFLLQNSDVPLVTQGQALLRWHQTHGYCSATGRPTHSNQAGSQRVCHSSGIIYYPQMAPVVIVLVSDGKRCLLARQSTFPRGMYSALSGFCDMGETVQETLRREVAEEVGLELDSVLYSRSQHWPLPQSSLMIGCHGTVTSGNTQISLRGSELEDARWFTLHEIQEALKRKIPARDKKEGPSAFWVPPSYAIANQLIQEWAGQQLKL